MSSTIKLFILYLSLWVILSGGKIELFPLVFIVVMSFLTFYFSA